MHPAIRALDPTGDASQCDDIVRSLPYFFGQEDGALACAEAVRSQRGWVTEAAGRVTGFLTVTKPDGGRAEITWMAVRPPRRRRGLGRLLVERAALELVDEGVEVLSVATVGPSTPEPGVQDSYDGTRRFYAALDFTPVRDEVEHPGWFELFLVRRLSHGKSDRAAVVASVCRLAVAWAKTRPGDVHGIALVGSWARGTANVDSDVDLVLLADEVEPYASGGSWLEAFPGEVVLRRQWGALSECRIRLPGGLEIDAGVAQPSWADTDPLDAGTAVVVAGGFSVLFDPSGRLSKLGPTLRT